MQIKTLSRPARVLFTTVLGVVLSSSALAAPDPLQAPACQQALAALRTHEDTHQARSAAWQNLRRAAAQTCLGEPDPPTAAPQRQLQPPVTVTGTLQPLAAPRPASVITRPAAPATAAPLVLPARPLSVTGCDASGCWASDGSRLNRVGGSTLLGPRGVCSVQSGLLNCP